MATHSFKSKSSSYKAATLALAIHLSLLHAVIIRTFTLFYSK